MTAKTIYVRLNKGGVDVLSVIIVKDEMAVTTFSDPNLAKEVFLYDQAEGENVAYSQEKNAYIKIYKGWKMEKIVEELKTQIEVAGGKLIDK